jgi:hypothetical protein
MLSYAVGGMGGITASATNAAAEAAKINALLQVNY